MRLGIVGCRALVALGLIWCVTTAAMHCVSPGSRCGMTPTVDRPPAPPSPSPNLSSAPQPAPCLLLP